MQLVGAMSWALPLIKPNTGWLCASGQALTQVPHPMHFEGSICGCNEAGSVSPASNSSALIIRLRWLVILLLSAKNIQKKTKLSERDEKTYAALKKAIEDKGKLDAELAFRNVRDQDYLQRRMQELLRGAKQYAKEIMIARKAHMVLATKVGAIQLEEQKDMQDELLRRRVVAHVKGVNITDDVMKKMNEEYAKRKAAKKEK